MLTGGTEDGRGAPPEIRSPWSAVPWRTIVASVLVVAGFVGAVMLAVATSRILLWVVIPGFFSIVLAPTVRRVQARLGGHRALATAVVMFGATLAFLGMVALFVMPIRNQVVQIASDLPGTVEEASKGTGPLGHLVTRLNLDGLARDHQAQLDSWATRVNGSSFTIARSVLSGLLAFVTIFVTAFLLLTQASALGNALLPRIPYRRRAAATRVVVDTGAAVSGYMLGNLFISVIAGTTAFLCLLLLGVPSPAVLALWVAFADLLPLVGATLGAVVAVMAAFLHSTRAGVIAVVFFIVYQQVENNVLQTAVMARTVKVNPLVVLLSVLFGVELYGFAGAILAIPLAGSIQVLIKEIWSESRRDRLLLPDEASEPPPN